jgi:hypothetical protein
MRVYKTPARSLENVVQDILKTCPKNIFREATKLVALNEDDLVDGPARKVVISFLGVSSGWDTPGAKNLKKELANLIGP